MKPNARAYAVFIALALVVAACGGATGGGDGGAADGGGATSVTVTGTEFAFDPVGVTVPADTNVTVTFENGGTIEHEWTVLNTRISSEAEFSEDMVLLRLVAPGGGSDSGTLNLPAGEYQVVCAIPGHFDAGMEGTLTVSG